MAQLFRPRANALFRGILIGGVLLAAFGALAGNYFLRSTYVTRVGIAPEQPVPFSHEHHVSGLGIDCRYCHTAVETSSFAGLPPTQTCMTCHSQIWTDAPMLRPVRESWRTGEPLRWTRVNDLPDFVYFDHSVHVAAGVSCVSCHGRVDRMPLTKRSRPFHMLECLECHRDPARHLRPREHVFDLAWQPSEPQPALGHRLLEAYGIRVEQLTDCSICHR